MNNTEDNNYDAVNQQQQQVIVNEEDYVEMIDQ
jgi:hypothetical protein